MVVKVLLGTLIAAMTLAVAATAATAATMQVQPDGGVLIGGYAYPGFAGLARFQADGSLDRTFGDAGIVVDRELYALGVLALRPDGRIVVGSGRLGTGFPSAILAGFGADGSPDPSFGAGLGVSSPTAAGEGTNVSAIVPRADGSITVSANHCCYKYGPPAHATVEGFSPNGQLTGVSTELAAPGQLSYEPGRWLEDLLPLADGSFLGVGAISEKPGTQGMPGMLLAHIDGAGPHGYDPTFGGGEGLVVGPTGNGRTVVPDGAGFLVGGTQNLFQQSPRATVVRFDGEGVLDKAFGDEGQVVLSLPGAAESAVAALAVGPDGSIYAAGTMHPPKLDAKSGSAAVCNGCAEPFVAKLTPSGALDPSFSEAGIERVVGGDVPPMYGRNLALLGDGRILVGGGVDSEPGGLAVVRLSADGRIDPSFGDEGLASVVPCSGSAKQMRSNGCLPSAKVGLTLEHARSRRPQLRLSVKPDQPWARLEGVQLILPREMWMRQAYKESMSGASASASGRTVTPKVHYRSINMTIGRSKWLTLSLAGGALRAAKRLSSKHQLGFRVVVKFGEVGREEGEQVIRIHRRP